MRGIALVIAFFVGLIVPAVAQKANIEAANAKWMEFFNKGDFDGVASLYTVDAMAFPPGSGMVKGRAAIGAMWKSMAEQFSDPKVTRLDVKRLGPSAAREIGTFSLRTKGPTPKEVTAVPNDHPVREVASVLDLSWVHCELAPYYPRLGRPNE
jgi:uncharacterized protein (TIGR02246 family)